MLYTYNVYSTYEYVCTGRWKNQFYETVVMHDECIPIELLDLECRTLDIQGRCSATTFMGKGI